MAREHITARLCRTRDGQPLAFVDGLPAPHACMTPDELFKLALVCNEIAYDAEQLPQPGVLECKSRVYPWMSKSPAATEGPAPSFPANTVTL